MNLSSQPLVSIVTPVYNEEEHLAECIESILAQTYQNWDYTIVNNCSTDGSLQIARRYAAKDRRIRIHDNNHFLEMIPNHNLAVRQISPASKYCKVVLGDDWIFPECINLMVAVAEAHPSVGVVSAYQQVGAVGDPNQVRHRGLPYEQAIITGREASRHFLLETLSLLGTPTAVLYRADLVRSRDPFYDETDMYADFEVCLALLRVSDLGFAHRILTFCRHRPCSVGRIAADVGARNGSLLHMLLTYGRDCLTDRELQQCLKHRLSEYHRFLGRRLFVEHSREFWIYHKRTLANLGITLRPVDVAIAAAAGLWRLALAPKSALETLKRYFALRQIRKLRNVVPMWGGTGQRP